MKKTKLLTTTIVITALLLSALGLIGTVSNAATFETFGPECHNLGFNPGHNTVVSSSINIKPPFVQKWRFNGSTDSLFSARNIVASNDLIYTISGSIGSSFLVSIDKKTGKKKDSTSIDPFLLPSLAMTKDLIFFGNMGELSAYDANTLKKKWKYSYKIDVDDFIYILYRASPTTYKDKVIFHDYENLVCLKSDGSVAWKTKCDNNLFGLATVIDDRVYYADTEKKTVVCYNFENGKKVWESEDLDTSITFIAAHESKLYIRGVISIGETYEDSKCNVCCMNASDGQVQWNYIIDDFISVGNPIANGKYIFNTYKKNTKCLDVKNGKELWSIENKDLMFDYPIIMGNNTVLMSSEDKSLYALDINNGNILNESKIDFINAASPAYDNKNIYLSGLEGAILCLEQDTDVEPWNIKVTPSGEKIKIDGQMQFNAVVLNKNNNQISGEVAWFVNPPDAGTISKTGLFKAAKPGKHKIVAKIKAITGEADIIVENLPPEFSTKSLDFGEVDFGSDTPKLNVEIKNNSKFAYDIKVTPSYSWIGVEQEKLTVEPGTTGTLTVFPVLEKMEPGKGYKGKVLLDWGDNQGELEFYVRIKKFAPLVYDQETTIKMHELKLNTTAKQIINIKNENYVDFKCNVTTEESWLTFNSVEFDVPKRSEFALELTVSTAGMKNDEARTGKFTLETKTGRTEFTLLIKTTNDVVPPTVEIQETFETTDLTEYEISGKVELDSKLEITQGEGKFEIQTDGELFKCKLMLLPAPSINKFKLKATDLAGNVTEKEIVIINSHLIDVSMTVNEPIMFINGKATPINPPPTIIKGATMVPLRSVAEVFGCEVTFTNGLIQIKTKKGDNIILNLNSTGAIVNNAPKTCKPPPTLYQGKTMVPFRFIAEALGAEVTWEQATKKIGMKLIVKP